MKTFFNFLKFDHRPQVPVAYYKPKEDITSFELAQVLRLAIPCSYCSFWETIDENPDWFPNSVLRHFLLDKEPLSQERVPELKKKYKF